MTPGELLEKLSLYAGEIRTIAGLPGTFAERAMLIGEVLAFHVAKNGRDRDGRVKAHLPLQAGAVPVRLRARSGDIAIFCETFSRTPYRIDESILPPDTVETIVDGGGHIGMAALYLADQYSSARIISIEPHPENFRLLQENTKPVPRIECRQACLADNSNDTIYMSQDGPSWAFTVNHEGLGAPVSTVAIAELLAETSVGRIDLLKLDIEGAEAEVLADAPWLADTRCIVAELHGEFDINAFTQAVTP